MCACSAPQDLNGNGLIEANELKAAIMASGQSDIDDEAYAFSDVPGEDDFDPRRKQLLEKLREECRVRSGLSLHHIECQFDLCWNHPEIIIEAFDVAKARLFVEEPRPDLTEFTQRDERASRRGTSNPPNTPEDLVVKLRYEKGGDNMMGHVGPGAKFESMRLVLERAVVEAVRPAGEDGQRWDGIDMGRAAVNVPWGVERPVHRQHVCTRHVHMLCASS